MSFRKEISGVLGLCTHIKELIFYSSFNRLNIRIKKNNILSRRRVNVSSLCLNIYGNAVISTRMKHCKYTFTHTHTHPHTQTHTHTHTQSQTPVSWFRYMSICIYKVYLFKAYSVTM